MERPNPLRMHPVHPVRSEGEAGAKPANEDSDIQSVTEQTTESENTDNNTPTPHHNNSTLSSPCTCRTCRQRRARPFFFHSESTERREIAVFEWPIEADDEYRNAGTGRSGDTQSHRHPHRRAISPSQPISPDYLQLESFQWFIFNFNFDERNESDDSNRSEERDESEESARELETFLALPVNFASDRAVENANTTIGPEVTSESPTSVYEDDYAIDTVELLVIAGSDTAAHDSTTIGLAITLEEDNAIYEL